MIGSHAYRAAVGFVLAASLLGASTAPALARKHEHASAVATPAPAATAATAPAPADMIPALEAQLKSTPHDTVTALRLAEAYLQVDRPDQSLQITQGLITGGLKNSAQAYFFNGAALRELGHPSEAIASLETASNIDPTSPIILVELSNAYLQANRSDDALRVAKRAAAFNTKDEHAIVNYGFVLAIEKQFDAARAQFKLAESLSPNDMMPMVLEARSDIDQSQYDTASKIYDVVLAKEPNNASALQGKAQIALAQHRPTDAIGFDERLFNAAVDDTAKAEVLNDEARVYLSLKQPDQAEGIIRREVTAFPNLPLAHISAGDLYLADGKEKDAVTEWTAALGPKQDGQVALMRLGMYALHQNDPKTAASMFGRLTTIDQNDDTAWFHLGQSLQLQSQFDRARDAFKHAFAIRQTVQSFADIASCDYELHNYQEAARIFDQLVAQAAPFVNGNPNLLFIVGKTYDAANEKSKARSAYYRVLTFVKRGSNDEKTIRSLIANLNKPAAPAAHTAARK